VIENAPTARRRFGALTPFIYDRLVICAEFRTAAYDLQAFRGVRAPFAFNFDKTFRMERQFTEMRLETDYSAP
jgi:hypothetical protein